MSEKPKLAMYWASSCGGCEISVVNLHEKILALDAHLDFMFCPCLLDTKEKDIEAMPDRSIALTLMNGAIRNGDNERLAKLLRRKSQTLVAFGSCSWAGSIPALSNLHTRADHFRSSYLDGPSVENPSGVLPQAVTEVEEGRLTLPEFHESVRTLDDVVEVDYFIPGCPPESHQVWNVVEAIISGAVLPPRGSVLGAGNSTVCEECTRKRTEKKIRVLHRNYEIIPDTETCLLEQGLVCMGLATREGCGGLCPQANMPCAGCYGPPAGVEDQGARMLSAIGSVLDLGDYKGQTEDDIREQTNAILAAIPDLAGTFYKFSLGRSILKRKNAA